MTDVPTRTDPEPLVAEPLVAEPLVAAAERLLEAGYRAVGERHRQLRAAYGDLRELRGLRHGEHERTGRWRTLNPAQTRALLAELDLRARRELLRLCADEVPQRPDGRLPARSVPGRHGVTSRIIVDRVLLEQPDGEQAIRALIGTGPGADVRIGSRLGASMWIIDGAEVVIGPLTGSGGDAAYIHSPQVAVALCQLFELLWKESVTMCRPSPHERLTPTQWRILQLLALGFDDPTLARITGTTVKTVRTHITAVLTALGAPTRFAAGAAAATRGWLS